MDAIDGALSAELICISGWYAAEPLGVRAAQPEAMIRFRADAAAGTRVNLVMRLAASGRDFRIRIRPGLGEEAELYLPEGAERLVVLPCHAEPGELITAQFLSVGAMPNPDQFPGASYWMLKGVLHYDPKRVSHDALKDSSSGRDSQFIEMRPLPPQTPKNVLSGQAIMLRWAEMEESRRAASFEAFLEGSDSYWLGSSIVERDAPIFADHVDRRAFYAGLRNGKKSPQAGRIIDSIKLIRRSNQFVSNSRLTEGSVFDRHGVWRGFRYLQGSSAERTPWLSSEADGIWVSEDVLSAAPYYEGRYLIFYEGAVHDYYHWLAGLLCLDMLSRGLGRDKNLKLVLPKSIESAAFDHIATLRAVNLGGDSVVCTDADLIKVQEAIWMDSDSVQNMPEVYLKDFQRRVSEVDWGRRKPRNKRLLVYPGAGRPIQNVEQVRTFIKRYGFETVSTEGMSIRDQISLFQSAEFVISQHDAGMANLLFCEPGTKIIELMPSGGMRTEFWVIAEKLDLVYAMQFCDVIEDKRSQGGIAVDIDKLEALVRMVDARLS
jgi:hypothetical protein